MDRYHFHQSHRLPHFDSPLSAEYAMSFLRHFGVSLVSIFGPLYIIKITNSVPLALLYFTVIRILEAGLAAILARFVIRIGFGASVFIANILLAFHLVALILSETDPLFLLPAIASGAMVVPLYWIPYHLLFVEGATPRDTSRNLGLRGIVERIPAALGPLLGGTIISVFGFPLLYAASAALILASSLPILSLSRSYSARLIDQAKQAGDVNLLDPDFRPYLIPFLGQAIDDATWSIAWPLFLFGVVGSYQTLGGIATLSLLLSMAVLLFASRMRRTKKAAARAGASVIPALWLAKSFMRSGLPVALIDIVHHIVAIFVWLPFDANVYIHAEKQKNTFAFIVQRDIWLNAARAIPTFALLILLSINAPWPLILGLGGIGPILASKVSLGEVSK